MYAIIKTGGKQYKVSKGDRIRVESLQAEVDTAIEFNEILAMGEGSSLKIGDPTIKDLKVKATVISVGREKKITVIKFRRRKDSRLKQGHRQYYTEVLIDDIGETAKKVAAPKVEKVVEAKVKEVKVAPKKAAKPKAEKIEK